MDVDTILDELIQMSHELGTEERQLAILGEGNLSADCGDGTFWVKASGSNMATIDRSGFSRVRYKVVMDLAALKDPSEEQIFQGLKDSLVEENMRQPSVETFLHAICLQDTEATFIAHTHPSAVLSILCSQMGANPFQRHIFPEPIPVCGTAPAVVSYVDPGFALAKAIQDSLQDYIHEYGVAPKMLLMVNHGLVALGQTAQQALNITLLADKWARIILGTYALGGPSYLSAGQVDRFADRMDEKMRQRHL